jgi:lipopolysaccharide transport system ATP-binding protein
MNDIAIKVENMSKLYRLGEIGTGTISKDLHRWYVTKIKQQEDPFLKIGQTNDRTQKGINDIVYSLQDVNFEINRGDAMGVIGRNGAGKSTLLKILSRVTAPTTGRIRVRGRVASLLEVGTGFHPELTGRENIFLNGAILGMRKHEIIRKLDEIIDFSGVERYIDTPVKRYSSGMYVRLAFAVAAHLESEILIVDEVLAVGDAEFQKKCLGKMNEVSKGDGRTVLFVSHNMAAIESLCNQAILLENGNIRSTGTTRQVIADYLNGAAPARTTWQEKHEQNELITIEEISASGNGALKINEAVTVRIRFNVLKAVSGIAFEMFVKDNSDQTVFSTFTETMSLTEGRNTIECTIPANTFNNSQYTITIAVSRNYAHFILTIDNAITIELQNVTNGLGWQGEWPGVLRPLVKWQLIN